MKEAADKKKYKVPFWKTVRKHWMLLAMLAPAVIYVVIFAYIPMTGVVLAFKNYQYAGGIYGSPWNGLDNFKALLVAGKLGQVTRNTLLYNIAFLFLGVVFEMGSAILLNEIQSKWFKKVSQTMMFLPYFISQVLVGVLVYNLLNYDFGFVNGIIRALGGSEDQLLNPYGNPNVWPVLMVLINLWQKTGYNSVVYFAAICGIDAEIIEAAKVDGANGFQKIRYIILPSLKPTIVILLLFALGGIVKGDFGLFYNIVGTNSLLYPTTDIIETYVYRATMTDFNFSYASAVGLYQSIIGFVMVMVVNGVVKKIEPDYSLF